MRTKRCLVVFTLVGYNTDLGSCVWVVEFRRVVPFVRRGGECVILRLVARLRKKDCFDLWRRVELT